MSDQTNIQANEIEISLTFRFPVMLGEAAFKRLKREAKEGDRPAASIVRRALREFWARQDEAKKAESETSAKSGTK
jgi:hypothetical protein